MLVVQEFYANSIKHEDGRAYVRGCQVFFDADTINQFYNTLDIRNDEYSQLVNGDIDLDEVLGSINILGTEWKVHKGVPISFKVNAMDSVYKSGRHVVGLWYPYLIIALCHQARVVWSTNEKLLHPKIPLDGGIINRFYMQEKPTIGGSSSVTPQPLQHSQNLSMLQQMERLEHCSPHCPHCPLKR
ncbi:Uncharacterized protein TCM_024515 [Theobroma cacao]|uniref:Uncharacterized protein n=1 Tax=Theobroma cacao TaxID=3641 RepID=A0A061EVL0_THECC|nr:Uncharacterized protein TCM_024515 [Theobroma cacao]